MCYTKLFRLYMTASIFDIGQASKSRPKYPFLTRGPVLYVTLVLMTAIAPLASSARNGGQAAVLDLSCPGGSGKRKRRRARQPVAC